MDLVKIGFEIKADGLEKANKEVDALLAKAAKLTNLGQGGTGGSGGNGKGGSNPSAKAVQGAELLIKKQEILNKFLSQPMDKQTARLATSFSLASDNAQDLQRFLNLIGQNKSLIQAQKAAEDLATSQKKAVTDAEKLRQSLFTREQQDYQKRIEAAKAAEDSTAKSAEDARQKKYKAEQDYHNKTLAAEKAKLESAKAVQEAARQQRFKAEQDYYSKVVAAEKAKVAAAEKAQETARQKRFKAEQDYHNKQMAHVQSLKDAEKARLAQQQKSIDLVTKASAYRQQGFSSTNANKIATMELSGADANTLKNYKQALLDSQKAMQGLGNAAQDAAKKTGFFNTQIGGIVKYAVLSAVIYGAMSAVVGLGAALVKTADAYTSIQNRMKLYISDATELAQVNDKLAQYAMNNNIGLRETSTLFARLAPSMQKIGANTAAVTTVVDAFGKSMRIGGATAMEAASATLQFSQAMASGKLAGDEFRSISEASPRFLKAIADGSGIAANKLKEMSSAGMLTTEVISKALIKEYANLSAENLKLGFTLEQGANAIKTSFTVMIGEFNEGAGITQFFGTQMMNLASGMMNAADGAKDFGASVKQWFSENKGIIEGVGKAIEVVAFLMLGKLVAGYVVSAAAAMQAAKANVTLVASQLGVSRSSAAATIATQRLGVAALQAGTMISTAGTMMKTAFAFLGGWVGLVATVVTATAAYLWFNKANAATAESFRKEGESLQETINKYKELGKVKQQSTLDSEKANLDELTKAYADHKSKLIANVLSLSRNNDMTQEQSRSISALAMSYKSGQISVEQLMSAISKAGYVSEESKVKSRSFATAVLDAGEKAGISKDLIAEMRKELTNTGDKAAFAKIGVDAFSKGLQDQAKKLKETTQLAKAYGLEIVSAAKLQAELASRFSGREAQYEGNIKKLSGLKDKYAKAGYSKAEETVGKAIVANQQAQNNLLQEKGKIAATYAKDLKAVEVEEKKQADYTAARRKAEKDSDKEGNKKQKDKDKYLNQARELETYISLLGQAQNVEVARIASEKEYQNAFGGNLTQAKVLYELQQQATQVGDRAEYLLSLTREAEEQDRIVELMKIGLNIDEARMLAQAKFTGDAKGKVAAELQLTNAAYAQQQAMVSQIEDQRVINTLLAQGYSLETATFRLRTAKVRTLSGKQDDLDELDKAFTIQVKQAAAAAAQQGTLLKINALNREGRLLAEAVAGGYTQSAIAAAQLAATTEGMTVHLAKSQLMKQDEIALELEHAQNAVLMNSYLAGESELLRDIKNAYVSITPEQLASLETERKHLKLLEDFAAKKEEQKNTPFGDFSAVNFDAFGEFGNPFKEALAGLNDFMAGNTKLNESLGIVQTNLEALRSKAFVEDMFGNANEVTKINKEIAGQVQLEQSLQAEKAKTQDLAYVQGIKFAKSFFKENTTGYKVVSAAEKAFTAYKIAMALKRFIVESGFISAETGAYVAGSVTKKAAELGFTAFTVVQKGIQAAASGVASLASSMAGLPFPLNIAAFAATAGLLASIGLNLGGGGSAKGGFAPTNEGTGTVFGGASDAKSESIVKAMEILADNSELGLPISSAMLKSLQNIESNIGGLTNLVIRGGVGTSLASGVSEGFSQDKFGRLFEKAGNSIFAGIGDFLGLNKMLGSVLGSLFGSKTSIKGQGLAGSAQTLSSINDGGFDLQEYVDIQTKKKSFGITTSTKNSTQYTKASDELSSQFTLIFQNLNDSLLGAAPLLGKNLNDVTNKLNSFVVNIGRINLQGLSGEEIQEKLTAIIGAESDKMAQYAVGGLESFQKVGEGYFETLIRVAAGVEEAQYYTERLNVATINYADIAYKQGDVAAEMVRQSILVAEGNKRVANGFYDLVNSFSGTASEIADFVGSLRELQDAIFATGKNGDYLTSTMIMGAGGSDALENGLEAYFELLSPAEQAAELTRRLTNEFSIFGKQLPSDVAAFRDLVNSIDITTTAGQKLYGQVIALTPEFADLQDSLGDVTDAAKAAADEAKKLADEFEAMMVKLRQAIYITGQSTNNITKAMIDAAGGGDALLKGLEAIYGMLSPAEKATELTRRMALAFGDIGLTLPTTNEAFRALVEGLDTSTLAGQELFGKLVILTPEFVQLQSAMTTVADEIAKAKKEAEDAAKTLAALKTAFYITGQSADRVTQSMIDAAGGTAALQGGLEAMFDMLSPAEQATELTRRLTEQFEALGLKLPTSASGFKDLVKYMSTSTEAGQALVGKVIALAPEFNTLQDALESANSEVNSLVQSLRDLASEASKAAGETNQTQNLDVLRSQFQSESLLAVQGDAAAAERLLTLGQSLMEVSKQYSVTSSDYARDLALIQRAATESANVQEAGLGYTAPTLNTYSGASTTVVETNNSSSDAKLDALREDMIAAIYAVAKYTQDTANRLERWDYGDRLNVHVEQDTNDKPLAVTSV